MTLLSALGLVCDLRASPWAYPGCAAPGPGLLIGSHFHAVVLHDGVAVGGGRVAGGLAGDTVDAVLAHEGVVATGARTWVVAVGSNGAPDVLRAKFERSGVSGVVPFVPAELGGVAVGHSAHVSLPGFLAAAPFAAPGAVTPVVASLLDDDQLDCLDVSERTYTRRPVTGEVRVGGSGECPDRSWIYDSDRGVLAAAPGSSEPLALQTQAALLALLAAADPGLADLFGGVDPRSVLPALAAGEHRRTAIRAHLAEHWARPSGLVTG
jgi:hypothetical protein